MEGFVTYTPRTMAEVQLMFPALTVEFLKNILYPLEITQYETVKIEDPHIFPRVLDVINNTPKRYLLT